MKRSRLSVALILVAVLVGAPLAAPSQTPTNGAALQIRAVLEAQVAAWNLGDIPAYMEGYWKSEKLVFAGATGVTRGWQATLERYQRTYPNRAAMGALAFSDLETTILSADSAFVLGRWHLKRGGSASASPPDVGGVFSLVLRRLPEGWRIIADHTSVVQ